MSDLLNVAEAAAYVRLSVPVMRRLLRDGDGPRAARIGTGRGRLFISRSDLAAWIESRTVPCATDRSRAA